MKVRLFTLSLLFLLWNLPAGLGQSGIVRCYTMEADQELRERFPQMGTLEDFEEWLAPRVREYQESVQFRAVSTIPVIFHVIHNGEAVGSGTNVSATYINAQIDQLNNDFRRILGTSGYNNDLRGADTELEFCPATVDPSGNALAEPGINRISRSGRGWTAPPYSTSYIDGTIKPQSYWNPDNYLNIWIMDLSGGLLGYAQFPSQSGLPGLNSNEGPAATDGVVVLYSSVGSTTTPFPNAAPYNEGRTLTHELGHFFGLRHIWGDANCGTDYCADTPTQQGPSSGCPNTTTCDGQADMVENYMDYSYDNCMNIFTNDQKARIQAVMANSPRRGALATSAACSGGGGGSGLNCASTISAFPYAESFESGLGGWTQGSPDDFDWTRDSGGTPSSNTGPATGADGSWYMYVEASSPNYPSKTTLLNSPCFDLNGATNATFTFQYHLYGAATMGSLFLEATTDGSSWTTLWSQSGNQGNQWLSASADLSAYLGNTVQLRFRGVTGDTWQSDMAVDDLSLATTTGGGGGGSCTDNEVTLIITLDQYPAETSWQITDGSGSVVASGGPYSDQPAGATVSETACLPDGCYDFTILDSYGDGICCSYGNGSYTLENSGGNVLASGGQFGASETTNFCVPDSGGGGGGGLTCSTTISSFPYSESFESSLGDWTQDSSDDFDWTRDSGGTPSSNTGPTTGADGSWYAYVEASSPNYPSKTTILNGPCFDLAAAANATFTFQYHLYGAAGMGSLFLEATTDGASWTGVWSQSGNQGNQWLGASVDLSDYLGGAVQLRFRGVTGTTWQGDMAIDDLGLSTSGSGGGGCNNVTLTIALDNYPEETSWQITDGGGSVVASGGTYGSQPDGSTVVETACLPDGCYNFTIFDAYGDGICCAYGNGSYTLTNAGGSVLASGGSFASSETTSFCVSGGVRYANDNARHVSGTADASGALACFPNPTRQTLNVRFAAKQDATVQLRIVDLLGRTVALNEWQVTTGKNQQPIDVTELRDGTYLLLIETADQRFTQRFMILK